MGKSKVIKCVLCEDNHVANYKDGMVNKDLQKKFFPALWRETIALKAQLQTKPGRIQSRLVLSRRS